jgi:hypothetical protein
MTADSPYIGFCVKLMPAQGSGGADYTTGTGTTPGDYFQYHEVVKVNLDGFADTIFDPSYGTRVDKASLDTRTVEQKYEDEDVTMVVLSGVPDPLLVPDLSGAPYFLTFTP